MKKEKKITMKPFKKTGPMIDREKVTGKKWEDEGDGYASLQGVFYAVVCYISLPKGHPDIDKGYDELSPDVNGGLTFANGNVFGWDYGHAFNPGTPSEDIKSALKYFKQRGKKK